MKIAILGAGNIGGTLGRKWLQAGHQVLFGVRDLQSAKTISALEQAQGAKATDVSSAIRDSEVILFSLPWKTVSEIVQANAANLNGKLLMDATNNFGGPLINNLEALIDAAPEAKIYRAFNSLGWEVFANPVINGQTADMFYSGPEGATQSRVQQLIEEIGVNPIWVGDNDRVHLVDNMGALWVNMVFQRGWKRHTAFKVIAN
jgi:8-hydroxy-5-deazaflavin:NADPH oxidoreductase